MHTTPSRTTGRAFTLVELLTVIAIIGILAAMLMPALVVCKADEKRFPAASFAALQNTNLSYFVGVNADFSQPGTVLAGDRNLACSPSPSPTILHTASGAAFWWTSELHTFNGNVLYADDHVEEWNNHAFPAFKYDPYNTADVFLPTVK